MHSLRYLLKITLIKRQYALHNFALPALATDYVLTPVVAAYFAVW
ncbi:putative membrane protein [Escherichia coli DEC13D]|nr:putative membrane protein [Escherichia coli DEC13D]EHX78334.1 putative membrane protein [Escherichia coli DEC13E]KDV85113.1 putative membrane protein [Escherichia coli 2-052-05_S4_C2]